MARLLAAIFLWAGAMTASASEPTAVLGTAPKVEPGELSRVPNEHAIASRIWMPALDAGFVPQGLTVAGDRVLVAAYRSTSHRVSRGESRVFAVDMKSGEPVGEFRLPDDVGHPGGLANDRRGTLFVADRGKLYRIDLARALADGHARAAVLGRADIDRGIGPSFLAWHAGHLWFGPYEKYGEPRLYRYPVSEVFPEDGNVYLTAHDDVHSIPIDVRTQGAAFDAGAVCGSRRAGAMEAWCSASMPRPAICSISSRSRPEPKTCRSTTRGRSGAFPRLAASDGATGKPTSR